MPVYGYRCSRGHHFEVQQRITDQPLTQCPECGVPVTRVFYPVGIIFKGGGFYKTDSRGASSDGSVAPADTKTETKAKTDAKAKTTPDSSSSTPATPPPAKTDDTASTKEGAV
jgi:putative FmdB family regulatory protein